MALKLPCYCASLRQATRAITQEYERALRPFGLTTTQFTVLTVLDRQPNARVNDMAGALAMDQTTVSRTLALMAEAGLIKAADGEDRRETRWLLTAGGRRKYQKALPKWQAAQKRIESLLGPDEATRLKAIAFRLTEKLAR